MAANDATNTPEQTDTPTQKTDEQVVQELTDELKTAFFHLFGEAVGDEWRLEERAAQGLVSHLAPDETILMANTVKMAKTGCLSQLFNMPDSLCSIAITGQRLIMAPIIWTKPSSKATIYSYDQLSRMYYKNKHWVIATKDKRFYPFHSGFGCGPGADKFLKALFAHFYDRASKVIVPPDYAGRDIKEAMAEGKVTVMIGE
ncbi:hypothetical protein [Candidatus Amarolinea dominans]|uniref:hypothetical protein n=1 Tax=Candidatus Amarolinea dominans TaxID=3140696 RepID=UPI001DBEE34F|nr:hypothetical protein [Anaerolineae bacterium]